MRCWPIRPDSIKTTVLTNAMLLRGSRLDRLVQLSGEGAGRTI